MDLTRRWLLTQSAALPDLSRAERDLTLPIRQEKITAPEYAGTQVYHMLYLPTDWKPGRRYPVIVEYPGNGNYRNAFGDVSTGQPEGCALGYGLTAGRGAIWLCLPFIDRSGQRNEISWWGDMGATLDYCHRAIDRVCAEYGGDPRRVLLAGFSRGAIACGYLGLRDDRIAARWCGFFAHSHWDGVRRWGYAEDDAESARRRAQRLRGRPVWISHEGSVEPMRTFVEGQPGRFTLRALGYRNHSAEWVLRRTAERRAARAWLRRVLQF